jgi:hypothetical protein
LFSLSLSLSLNLESKNFISNQIVVSLLMGDDDKKGIRGHQLPDGSPA